jgi:hypothetical protein
MSGIGGYCCKVILPPIKAGEMTAPNPPRSNISSKIYLPAWRRPDMTMPCGGIWERRCFIADAGAA